MSIRESRLCDYKVGGDLCRSPFHARCWLCEKDACYEHFGRGSVMTLIVLDTGDKFEGQTKTLGLGGGTRMAICTACRMLLPSARGEPGILDALAATLDDKIIPELRAWLASQTMKAK